MEGLKAKAAQSLGVTPGEIAKSLLFKLKKDFIMILMAGDKRIDNRKFKDLFNAKAKMPEAKEVVAVTGHPVGGVCPFGKNKTYQSILIIPCNHTFMFFRLRVHRIRQ